MIKEKELPTTIIFLTGIIIGGLISWAVAMSNDSTCTANIDEAEKIMMQIYNLETVTHGFVHRDQTIGRLIELYNRYSSGPSREAAAALINNVCIRTPKPINWTFIESIFGLPGENHTFWINTTKEDDEPYWAFRGE